MAMRFFATKFRILTAIYISYKEIRNLIFIISLVLFLKNGKKKKEKIDFEISSFAFYNKKRN